MKVVEERVRQALSLGYYQALRVAERHLVRDAGGALAPQHTESLLARDHVNTPHAARKRSASEKL
jgi:hypothetical protein